MNYNISPDLYQHLRTAKNLASNRLLRPNFFANVVGVGIGPKVVDGDPTETWCIRIYVQSKLYLDDLTPSYLLPSSFLDVPTDVIEVGSFGRTFVPATASPPSTGPGSAIRLNSRASNVNSGAVGTLGAVVVDTSSNNLYILSCNHVLTVNGRFKTDSNAQLVAADGTEIAKPGIYKELKRYEDNQVDCALASTKAYKQVPETAKPIMPERGMNVRKTGAVTG
jgi:hypothetical protein